MPKRINSRQKGARGEREASKKIEEIFGVPARRGQQFSGGAESPDVITALTFAHIEIKRVERLNIENAVKQAVRDAGDGKIPVVLHRKNNGEWLATMRLRDVPSFADKLNKYNRLNNEGQYFLD